MFWSIAVLTLMGSGVRRPSTSLEPTSTLFVYNNCAKDDDCDRFMQSCSCFVAGWRVCCVVPPAED